MRIVAIAFLALASVAWAGDEFRTPTLREGSAYDAKDPSYRVIGIEDDKARHTLWVVADPEAVLNQKGVNRIIKDIRRRNLSFTEIEFYSAVRDKPQFPAFRITDAIAVYRPEENKTYYGVAAKHLYGGWAYGPQK